MASNKLCENQDRVDLPSNALSKIGKKLYLKPEIADVHFVFESDSACERLSAHKTLLAGGSDVFYAMFYGTLKEMGDINIVDVSAEAFKLFLQFFYFSNVEMTIESVAEVMYLGNKYDVADCLKVCSDYMTSTLSPENVIFILGQAIVYDQVQLQEMCESKIRLNSKEILQSTSFLECDRPVIDHILKMDRLSCSESEVFEACMSWVRIASKENTLTRDILKEHLGESFYEICFGSMSMDEFVEILPIYGKIFSTDEYNEILQTISKQEIQPKMFKECRQAMQLNENKIIKCNRFISNLFGRRYYTKPTDTTIFIASTPLLFGYFIFYPLYSRNNDDITKKLNVKTTIVSDSRAETQFSNCVTFSNGPYIINLPKPIVVKPGIRYEIQLSLPDNQYYLVRELKPIVTLDSDITVEFYNDPVVKGTKTGLIYELGFNLLE